MSITQAAKDFGVDVTWAVARRREYLDQRIAELKNDQQATLQAFSGNNELNRFLLLDSMRFTNKEIQRLENELRYTGKESSGRITKTDIERAKQHSLENLLQNIRNNKTNCISGTHEDKHPSLDIRNNFAYCYSCGFHGDAITVYQKLHSVDFVTAVKKLNC